MDWAKTTARWGEKHLRFWIWCINTKILIMIKSPWYHFSSGFIEIRKIFSFYFDTWEYQIFMGCLPFIKLMYIRCAIYVYISVQLCWHLPLCSSGWIRKQVLWDILIGHQRRTLSGEWLIMLINQLIAGIILCMHPTNERRRYIVTSSSYWLGAYVKWSLDWDVFYHDIMIL